MSDSMRQLQYKARKWEEYRLRVRQDSKFCGIVCIVGAVLLAGNNPILAAIAGTIGVGLLATLPPA